MACLGMAQYAEKRYKQALNRIEAAWWLITERRGWGPAVHTTARDDVSSRRPCEAGKPARILIWLRRAFGEFLINEVCGNPHDGYGSEFDNEVGIHGRLHTRAVGTLRRSRIRLRLRGI